jgi:hypothetical protein
MPPALAAAPARADDAGADDHYHRVGGRFLAMRERPRAGSRRSREVRGKVRET